MSEWESHEAVIGAAVALIGLRVRDPIIQFLNGTRFLCDSAAGSAG